MSASEASAVWSQLREEGLVSGEPPDSSHKNPWPLRLLAGVGAWLGTLLMLGFVAALLALLEAGETGLAILGGLMCAASAPLVIRRFPELVQQCGTVLNVAGLLAFGAGVGSLGDWETKSELGAGTVLATSAVLFTFSSVYAHRFLCASALIGAAIWLVSSGERLSLIPPAMAWLAAGLWLALLRSDPHSRLRARLSPAAWAATIYAAWLAFVPPTEDMRIAQQALSAAILPAAALGLTLPHRASADRLRLALLVVTAVVLAWVWHASPGVTLALTLMLLAFALGSSPLLGVAVITLAFYMVAYYYQLSVPLLDKSMWLGLAGALLIGLRGVVGPLSLRRSA